MFSNIDKASKVTSQVSCTFHFHSSKHNHFFEICQNSIRTDSLKEQMNLVTCLFCLLWEILRLMSKRNNTFRLFPDWLLLVCCCEKNAYWLKNDQSKPLHTDIFHFVCTFLGCCCCFSSSSSLSSCSSSDSCLFFFSPNKSSSSSSSDSIFYCKKIKQTLSDVDKLWLH